GAQRRRRPGASAQIYGRGNEKDGSNGPILAAEAGRREQEMKGCIQERSPGHWAIVLSVQDATGKRKRHWHSFKGTKKEAQAERALLIGERGGGGPVSPTGITVADSLNTFEKDCALHLPPPVPTAITPPWAMYAGTWACSSCRRFGPPMSPDCM